MEIEPLDHELVVHDGVGIQIRQKRREIGVLIEIEIAVADGDALGIERHLRK